MNSKLIILMTMICTIFFSCGGDDNLIIDDPQYEYPLTAKFVSILEKQNIQVFTNLDGVATEVANIDTQLDEDSFFNTIDANFREVIFTSNTEAKVITNQDVLLPDTFDITYTQLDNNIQFAFDLTPLGFPVTLISTAIGNPTSFKIQSQAYKFFEADGNTYNSIQYNIETIDDLKMELEDELEPFSSFANQYYNQLFEEE